MGRPVKNYREYVRYVLNMGYGEGVRFIVKHPGGLVARLRAELGNKELLDYYTIVPSYNSVLVSKTPFFKVIEEEDDIE